MISENNITPSKQKSFSIEHRIDRMIQMLGETKEISEDNTLQRRRLTLVQMKLSMLINELRQ